MAEETSNFEELCAGYVLNALSAEDEIAFLRLLDSATAEEKKLYEDMRVIASEMALLTADEAPSTQVKNALIERAWKSVNRPDGANILYLNRYKVAVAASIILMLSSIGLFLYTQDLNKSLISQAEIINDQATRIENLQSDIERKETLLTILEARDVDLVLMDGLEVNPDGFGKVVWDKDNGRALLQVANLPVVPSQNDYQLWIIINNQPISAGVFAVNNPLEDDFFTIENLNNRTDRGAFAITLEPKGGSTQPTGDMYLLGNLN